MSKKIILMGFTAICMALAGCNSGNGTGAPVNMADLLGRWNFTQAKYHDKMKTTNAGKVVMDTTTDTTMNVAGQGFYVEFKDSSKFTANIPSQYTFPEKASAASIPTSGTWSVAGNLLTLISVLGTFKDTLVVQTAITGSTAVFTTGDEETYTEGTYTTTTSSTTEFTATKAAKAE
jgi:hypothetical protein